MLAETTALTDLVGEPRHDDGGEDRQQLLHERAARARASDPEPTPPSWLTTWSVLSPKMLPTMALTVLLVDVVEAAHRRALVVGQG